MTVEIAKIFRIICPDCKEVHEDKTWRDTRAWLPKHRKQNSSCGMLHPDTRRKDGIPRDKKGRILYFRKVTCPICLFERPVNEKAYSTSLKRNALHPELVGIHRTCRMRVIKPAKKDGGQGVRTR